ncbi:MAG: MarR family winged helix-turn-helix transcriptional regulator [Peptococcales bacterium]|jgi:DNA-binding MarR family transcriptional regulator
MNEQERSIGRWLSITYRIGQTYLDKNLKPYNLGSGQGMFLATLLCQDGISQKHLATALHIDKGTTARAIKKLEIEGYIVKKIDPHDKRVNLIKVTEKAKVIQPVLKKVWEDWINILTSGFSQEERKKAADLLQKMAQNAARHGNSD